MKTTKMTARRTLAAAALVIAGVALSTPAATARQIDDSGMTPWEIFQYICGLENGKAHDAGGAFYCVYPDGSTIWCTPDMSECSSARKPPKRSPMVAGGGATIARMR